MTISDTFEAYEKPSVLGMRCDGRENSKVCVEILNLAYTANMISNILSHARPRSTFRV